MKGLDSRPAWYLGPPNPEVGRLRGTKLKPFPSARDVADVHERPGGGLRATWSHIFEPGSGGSGRSNAAGRDERHAVRRFLDRVTGCRPGDPGEQPEGVGRLGSPN